MAKAKNGRPKAVKPWGQVMRYTLSVNFLESPQAHALLFQFQKQNPEQLDGLIIQALQEYIANNNLPFATIQQCEAIKNAATTLSPPSAVDTAVAELAASVPVAVSTRVAAAPAVSVTPAAVAPQAVTPLDPAALLQSLPQEVLANLLAQQGLSAQAGESVAAASEEAISPEQQRALDNLGGGEL